MEKAFDTVPVFDYASTVEGCPFVY